MNNYKPYSSYKSSNNEWLGKIPDHWDSLANKFIFRIHKKLVGKKSNQYDLLSLTLKGIVKRDMINPKGKFPAEFDTYQEVKKGDFVFCMFDVEETPRAVGLSPFDGMITGAYTVMKVNEIFDVNYLFHFYQSLDEKKRFKPLYRGLRNTVPKEAFMAYKAYVPPIEEQTAIANFLDNKTAQIKDFIALKEKTIEKLKERKTAIINQAVTKGLDPNVEMKDSGIEWLGEIPKHWEVKKLKFISQLNGRIGFRGYQTSDLVSEEHGAITLSPSNMKEMGMNYKKCTYLSWVKYHESPEIKIENEDVLFVKTGSTYGKVSFVNDLPKEATINPQILVFKDIKIKNKYFYFSLLSGCIKEQTELGVIGGTIPTISQTKIGNFKITHPPLDEQSEIVEYINEKSKELNLSISQAEKEIEIMKEYQQSLISEAVTGKIDVRNLEVK